MPSADMAKAARRGFEFLIDHAEGGQDLIGIEDISAYVTYGSRTCADLINGNG
jgi:hypothetical protein